MTKDQFILATGITLQFAERWYSPVMAIMEQFEINTSARRAHFLGQVGVESGNFNFVQESLNYSVEGLKIFGTRLTQRQREQLGRKPGEPPLSAERQAAIANLVYGGRYGNNLNNDGWIYRGRGLKQITFRHNYIACARALGLPLEEEPDLLLRDSHAASSAGWFWQANNCNKFADTDDISGLTRCINGGFNGLQERTKKTLQAMAILL